MHDKQSINNFINLNYKGSLRFIKDKMFVNTFGIDLYRDILDKTSFLISEKVTIPFSRRVYCYINNILEMPKCKMCTSNTTYNTNGGYQTYCSVICKSKDNDSIQAKKRKTNLERYGHGNFLASSEGKQKLKQTHQRKYGVDHYNQTEEYKERCKTGKIQRNSNPQKVSKTLKQKFLLTITEKYKDIELLSPVEDYFKFGASTYHNYDWLCKVCNTQFSRWLNMGWKPECPTCAPKGTNHEIKIKQFLSRNCIPYIFRDRKALGNGQEIDIYIPSKKIGIEYHGLYYHHDKVVDKFYHLCKLEQAEKQGIRLIQIFGDEIFKCEGKVYSRLKHILGLVKRRIYARKCVVQELTTSQKSKFLNKYHIQGNGNGSKHLGLSYKNRLVAVMEFCKTRPGIGKRGKDKEYELMRYATISHFTVVGGAGKLLKYFIKNNETENIISYADRRWSQGNVYKQLGFSQVSTNQNNIGYWYTKDCKQRLHRIGFQRRLLKAKLEIYDEKLSECNNMYNNGYYRVWDCGVIKFEMQINI